MSVPFLELNLSKNREALSLAVEASASLIARVQRPDGEIPWFEGGKTDPRDHVESAMGLDVGGYRAEAERAYEWLARMQLADGSWYAAYREGQPEDRTRDANFTAYAAVGAFHHFLITGDRGFLAQMWPTVASALDFSLGLQADGGEIWWAVSPEGRVDRMALLTGSSSIYFSLKCALAIARQLGRERPDWEAAMRRLGHAIAVKPYRFNMTKSRFSMDWFYPVLSGVLTGEPARARIDKYWRKFVVEGQGVRCVSDQPWVTLAETSELSLALSAMGNDELARILLSWIWDRRFEDGSFWAGFTVPDLVRWPEEKIAWTNAVVLMAADAVYRPRLHPLTRSPRRGRCTRSTTSSRGSARFAGMRRPTSAWA